MLSRIERPPDQFGTHLRRTGVEENLVIGVGKRSIEVCSPPRHVMFLSKPLNLLAIPPNEDRIHHQPVAVAENDAALVADGEDRADEVLIVAHPPGHAVHDQPNPPLGHCFPPVSRLM